MTLFEFEQQVLTVALASPICDVPVVVRLTPTSMKLRVEIGIGGFLDAFYNEQTGTTAFALIRNAKRIFGADNTGGWHIHPFDDPSRHDPLIAPMSFADFVGEIEQRKI